MSLSRSQVTRLSRRIEQRRESLLAEIRDELAHSENQQYIEIVGNVPTDLGDAATGDTIADLNLALIDRHVRELRQIDAATRRIDAGRLDACAECGEDIGFERLLAYPTAERCRRCQQQRERTYVHEAMPTL